MVGVSEEVASAELCRDEEVIACAVQAEAMSGAIGVAEKEKGRLVALDKQVTARAARGAGAAAVDIANAAAAAASKPKQRLRGKRGSV